VLGAVGSNDFTWKFSAGSFQTCKHSRYLRNFLIYYFNENVLNILQ